MRIISNDLNGVLKIETEVHSDDRGWFCEGYNKESFRKLGINIDFIQDNFSLTKHKGTIRGLHYQHASYEQTKLFRCIKGKVLDVVVDIRVNSPSFFKWKSYELSEEQFAWILVPKGFAHGFQSLTDDCLVQYKVDEYYSKEHDYSIFWNDPHLKIDWPITNPILSEKDKNAPCLKDVVVLGNFIL